MSDYPFARPHPKWKEIIRRRKKNKITKGDFEGHPFRGNQYVRGLSADAARSYRSAKEYIKKEFKKVYHFTDAVFDKFNNPEQGVFFTDNQYGVVRMQSKGKVRMERFINVNSMNWAKDKDAGPFLLDGREAVVRELKAQGFDGIKRTVDGDTHFHIFDEADLHTESELINFYNESQEKNK